MKIQKKIKTIGTHACVYFTILSLALYTGGKVFSGTERQWIPTLAMMYMAFLFSLLFAAVNHLVLPTKLPGILKLLIHYPVTLLLFYIIFVLWGASNPSGASVLVILLAFTVLYAIGALIRFLIRYLFVEAKNDAAVYRSQFRKE